MIFQKYPSLIRSDELAKGKLRKYTDNIDYDFVASEKIHGCNFAIYYDGYEFKYAKRTSFLEPGDELFGYEDFLKTEKAEKVKAILADFFHHSHKDYKQVILYGELFGGEIQDNVTYAQTLSGDKDFRVFNLMGLVSDNLYDVLGYNKLAFFFGDYLAPYADKGKLWDLLKSLDMDKPSEFGGISEGYVLQPYDDRQYSNGDTFLSIKHKTHHFTEVTPAKLNDLIGRAATLEDLKRYITVNRFYNVLSKGYENSLSNVGNLIDIYIDDIFNEYSGELIPEGDITGYKNQLKPLVGRMIYTNVNK